MKSSIRSVVLLALLLCSSRAPAELVERRAVSFPQSNVVAAGPGRVTSGGSGKFLVYGQRITPDGTSIDAEPVFGTDGFAVAWPDGWLIVNPRIESIEIRHLGDTGASEAQVSLAPLGQFVDAASNGRRLAILELVCDTYPCMLWVTVTDGAALLERKPIERAESATVAPFLGGFLVAARAHPEGAVDAVTVSLRRLDADGTSVARRSIGIGNEYLVRPLIAADGDKALLTLVGSIGQTTARVVDASLATSAPVALGGGPGTDVSAVAFSTPGGFMVAYTLDSYAPRVSKSRAALFDRAGRLVSDGASDPIASGDRAGDRFLVMRPWGDAAIAEHDPRSIVTPAFHLLRREWKNPYSIIPVASGDVTLILPRSYPASGFVRVDRDGSPIDSTPQPSPSQTIVATPGGFAFLSISDGTIGMRRLSRRGEWIDASVLPLAVDRDAIAIAAHCSGSDMLVAWYTPSEIAWSRFAFDGTPLQTLPSRIPFDTSGEFGTDYFISIAGDDSARLLSLQGSFECFFDPCLPPELFVHFLALDASGNPLGTLQSFESASASPKALALAGGTWLFPALREHTELLHLRRDASLIARTSVPELDDIADLAPTPAGWHALCGHYDGPTRLVEIEGADRIAGTIGLSSAAEPMFVAGDRIAYLAESAELAGFLAPWTARLVTSGVADLSIRLTFLGVSAEGGHFEVAIRNAGPQAATGVGVYANRSTQFSGAGAGYAGVARLLPGETRLLGATAAYGQPWERFRVLSNDTLDPDPLNDVVTPADAPPPQPGRRRPSRGGN